MVDLDPFVAASEATASAIRSLPRGTRWFVDADTDADGLCAAAVMAQALRQVGHHVQVRASRDKHASHYEALADAPGDALLLLDKGSSHVHQLPQGRPVVVVDHHNVPVPPPAHVTLLNPRTSALDGSRHASASTTAAALALALVGDAALRWAPTALSGAIGDWQHRPAWEGWNLVLLEKARAAGHVAAARRPDLVGVDLADAVRRQGIDAAALAGLGIDGRLEVDQVDPEASNRLVSALALRRLATGEGARAVRRLVVDEDQHVPLGASLRTVFRTVDACGRLGQAATGLSYLLGDPAAAEEAHGHFATYRRLIREALEVLPEAVVEAKRFRHAWTGSAALTGMVAGLAVESGRVPADRPLCVLAPRPDGNIQVSTRALASHVAAGLDLGSAVAAAAVAVEAEGGGHPVAAGAVIPGDAADAFLAALDKALEEHPGHQGSSVPPP